MSLRVRREALEAKITMAEAQAMAKVRMTEEEMVRALIQKGYLVTKKL